MNKQETITKINHLFKKLKKIINLLIIKMCNHHIVHKTLIKHLDKKYKIK